MSAKVLMGVDEYLKTSFDGPDCEYLDGEVVERNMGEWPHARAQGNLHYLLRVLEPRLGILVVPEIRIQINCTRYRVADVAVWREGNLDGQEGRNGRDAATDVVSPEDCITRMQPKIVEYLSIGVEWIWLIDPIEKSAIC